MQTLHTMMRCLHIGRTHHLPLVPPYMQCNAVISGNAELMWTAKTVGIFKSVLTTHFFPSLFDPGIVSCSGA